jgi:hypothetical protein
VSLSYVSSLSLLYYCVISRNTHVTHAYCSQQPFRSGEIGNNGLEMTTVTGQFGDELDSATKNGVSENEGINENNEYYTNENGNESERDNDIENDGTFNPLRLDNHFKIDSRSELELETEQIEDAPSLQELHSANEPEEYREPVAVQVRWYQALPPAGTMRRHQWLLVTCGILFVTVTSPTLGNWALMVQQLPLSLVLTLTSLGPIYMVIWN